MALTSLSKLKAYQIVLKNVDILKKYGHKAFLVAEDVGGETWFRVYIGDFNNEKAALNVGAELQEEGIISYFKPVEIHKDIADITQN